MKNQENDKGRVQRSPDIYVAVTHTSHTLDNTGIQRVTRSLCRALEQDYPAASFVAWNDSLRTLVPLDRDQSGNLSAYCGPKNTEPRTDLRAAPAWIGHLPIPRKFRRMVREAWRRKHAGFAVRAGGFLIIPEWVTGEQMQDLIHFAEKYGLKSVAIFHDAIAIDYPELVSEKYRTNHYAYLKAMSHCDLVLANSLDSFRRFERFVDEEQVSRKRIDYVELAGEIVGTRRVQEPNVPAFEIRALCVGSLDPRKNHRRLIQAFERIWLEQPELPLKLHLVGGKYDREGELSRWVEQKVAEHPNLLWKGRVSDEDLREEYLNCHFTCFPSIVEGFGIPVLESLWNGRPCLCSDQGVVGDLSLDGGCMRCNVLDVDSIEQALRRMCFHREEFMELSRQAIARPIKTWLGYGMEVVEKLQLYFG